MHLCCSVITTHGLHAQGATCKSAADVLIVLHQSGSAASALRKRLSLSQDSPAVTLCLFINRQCPSMTAGCVIGDPPASPARTPLPASAKWQECTGTTTAVSMPYSLRERHYRHSQQAAVLYAAMQYYFQADRQGFCTSFVWATGCQVLLGPSYTH